MGTHLTGNRKMSDWDPNNPGHHPVCIVGAGFSQAILENYLPSTSNLIEDTVRRYPGKFPILSRLFERFLNPSPDAELNDARLNVVWQNVGHLTAVISPFLAEILSEYESNTPPDSHLSRLIRRYRRERSPQNFIFPILGIELKRMLALQYDHPRIRLPNQIASVGLDRFLRDTTVAGITWVSLNYDTVLEALLQTVDSGSAWAYCFENWFDNHAPPERPKHIIVKPHGSLNVWFDTLWGSPNRHSVYFADRADRLITCPEDMIGVERPRPGVEDRELRPWLIGYVRDELKDEINSPGYYGDSAHDLCKANLARAALVLQKATSLYVLGYSMPDGDSWVWARVEASENISIPVYVASRGQTDRIVRRFRQLGFYRAGPLTTTGMI